MPPVQRLSPLDVIYVGKNAVKDPFNIAVKNIIPARSKKRSFKSPTVLPTLTNSSLFLNLSEIVISLSLK
ncbi:hypothetical protein BMS3Abin04_01990 [bacterium BMS3Abin04]|nr:hypothetical protein BMS3Abin04_01990 [bacterium BMS3Abin04]